MILLVKLFESLPSCLFDAKRVHETEVDERKREFASFVKSVQESLSELFSSSRITTELVVLPCHTSPRQRIPYQKFWGLVKCLLVLSPGGGGGGGTPYTLDDRHIF